MAWNIKRALNRYDYAVEDLLDVVSELIVGEMVNSATFFKAVDTGNYRSNFRWRKTGKKKREIFNNTEYAIWIELGTSKMSSRPVMRFGLLNAKQVLDRRLGVTLHE